MVSVNENYKYYFVYVSYLDLTATYFGMFLTLSCKLTDHRHLPECDIIF